MIRLKKLDDKNLLEIYFGLYSDEAYRAIEFILQNCYFRAQLFQVCIEDRYVLRAADGEIYITKFLHIGPLRGNLVKVFSKSGELESKMLGEDVASCEAFFNDNRRSCSGCEHLLECYKKEVLSVIFDAANFVLYRFSDSYYNETETIKSIKTLYDAWAKEDYSSEEYKKLVGEPLDPFRLATIATLKKELDDLYEKNKHKNSTSKIDRMKKEYLKSLGAL